MNKENNTHENDSVTFNRTKVEKYLIPPTDLHKEKFYFSVISPKKIKWGLILLITYFLDFLFIKAFSIIGLLLIILIAYLASILWEKSYSWIIKKLLIPGLKEWKDVKQGKKRDLKETRGLFLRQLFL